MNQASGVKLTVWSPSAVEDIAIYLEWTKNIFLVWVCFTCSQDLSQDYSLFRSSWDIWSIGTGSYIINEVTLQQRCSVTYSTPGSWWNVGITQSMYSWSHEFQTDSLQRWDMINTFWLWPNWRICYFHSFNSRLYRFKFCLQDSKSQFHI